MDYSTPNFLVFFYLSEFAQTYVHWVGDVIHPSHSLLPPSPTLNLSQHQDLFKWVRSSNQVAKHWSFRFSISSPNEYSGLISFGIYWFDLLVVQGTQESSPTPRFESINISVFSLQVALVVKNTPANAGDIRDVGSIPGLGSSPRGGHGSLLKYSCLENPMNRGAWWATVHSIAQSRTQLKQLSMQPCKFLYGPNLTYIHDYWKDHNFDYTDCCQQRDVSAF